MARTTVSGLDSTLWVWAQARPDGSNASPRLSAITPSFFTPRFFMKDKIAFFICVTSLDVARASPASEVFFFWILLKNSAAAGAPYAGGGHFVTRMPPLAWASRWSV